MITLFSGTADFCKLFDDVKTEIVRCLKVKLEFQTGNPDCVLKLILVI